ncbi:1-(5-phosphoribosyl)-5-[(5-phosphoribosylamino)methylideneamino]imidazole-4-carboxamide isomerase [Buchnera aphidicola]|uniref:1-(5-phosphoribosyl)-5-[(5- phosphoribosylamino)methylideneamino]imidazole-4- carboxamide isomerase n=1 Tax=Buchnera aphidicola TaxID=9 RepID=UPI00223781E0|nr:1-(5-phosphoribosyl)-5-[(5-phosphoribosylamino)methylideneamino]imidazole-4-carboxamide isomerase [Buchnera aphidicola]MCW5197610.1 1-(5-phosphoribosyl)-5-[(5-phosphoribosylamino)methylideneamino]imidazole-4-carboxamide isomerase [Buchnera aphidicola (Chaitophorus viminalis)]
MIIPSLDFYQGKIVRLYQGNYDLKKMYIQDYYTYIQDCIQNKIKNIHIVDLDGAKNFHNKQSFLLKEILQIKNINFQVGGGIRNKQDIEKLFSLGAKKVVIGSAIFEKKNEVKQWIQEYGKNSIVLALDVIVQNNFTEVIISGWKKNTGKDINDILSDFYFTGVKNILCTDITQDGTLNGPNISLYESLVKKYPRMNFQSSGGIGRLKDIINLKKIGIKDIIIGKAFLENKFTMTEAVQCWQKELFHV